MKKVTVLNLQWVLQRIPESIVINGGDNPMDALVPRSLSETDRKVNTVMLVVLVLCSSKPTSVLVSYLNKNAVKELHVTIGYIKA